LGPRLPVAMSSRTPVRDDWSAPRDLSASLVTRLAHGLPQAAPQPDHGPYLASRCYDVTPAPAGLKPISDGMGGAKDPVDPASRYCDDVARPWTICVSLPAAFSRPWQWTTSGLPCPASLPIISRSVGISPAAPSTTGQLTFWRIHQGVRVAPAAYRLSPQSTGNAKTSMSRLLAGPA
jgi:hypothetical protein